MNEFWSRLRIINSCTRNNVIQFLGEKKPTIKGNKDQKEMGFFMTLMIVFAIHHSLFEKILRYITDDVPP